MRSHLRGLCALVLFAAGLCNCVQLSATTVVAPSFSELVAESEVIVRARVVAVQPYWADTPQGRIIKTRVTLATVRSLKGRAAPEFTLDLLGGELDGTGMEVTGMPHFEAGQVELLFVSGNGVRFCPLVGMMYGRYQVRADPATAREYVVRNDGLPLLSADDVQLPHEASPVLARLRSTASALSLAAFEQQITNEVSRRALP